MSGWRGPQALAAVFGASAWWEQAPDVLAFLSQCDSCGAQALTRTQHETWICPRCAEFREPEEPEPEPAELAGQIEVKAPIRKTPAAHPIRHAYCNAAPNCTGYHCARCGDEILAKNVNRFTREPHLCSDLQPQPEREARDGA